jgi:hypothetical protein
MNIVFLRFVKEIWSITLCNGREHKSQGRIFGSETEEVREGYRKLRANSFVIYTVTNVVMVITMDEVSWKCSKHDRDEGVYKFYSEAKKMPFVRHSCILEEDY